MILIYLPLMWQTLRGLQNDGHPDWGALFYLLVKKRSFVSGETQRCWITVQLPVTPLSAATRRLAAAGFGAAAAAVVVVAAAVAEQEQQDDDPPPVVAAEPVADATVVITTHKNTSGRFSRASLLIPMLFRNVDCVQKKGRSMTQCH